LFADRTQYKTAPPPFLLLRLVSFSCFLLFLCKDFPNLALIFDADRALSFTFPDSLLPANLDGHPVFLPRCIIVLPLLPACFSLFSLQVGHMAARPSQSKPFPAGFPTLAVLQKFCFPVCLFRFFQFDFFSVVSCETAEVLSQFFSTPGEAGHRTASFGPDTSAGFPPPFCFLLRIPSPLLTPPLLCTST